MWPFLFLYATDSIAGEVQNFAATATIPAKFGLANLLSIDDDKAIAQPNFNFNQGDWSKHYYIEREAEILINSSV